EVFASYEVPGRAVWSSGPLRGVDLSGVAFDHPRTATLISRQHVLMAQHYRREARAPVVFHDRTGRQHIGYVVAVKGTPGGIRRDIAVGRLLKPVALKPYRVLPPRHDYPRLLEGAPVIVTDRERRLFVHRLRRFTGRLVWYGPDPEEGLSKRLIRGDSGNPSFLLVNGEPVLVQIQSGTGWGVGPWISHPENFAAINRLMREVGGTEQLAVVPVVP
ncbi:MAG: hypothetical protein HKO57_04440, partial [Akkermansiaceae bacterium]|nr:hypothetical protein [Akkermansiaceae bacterium]